MGTLGIKDVPCLPCQKGYLGRHECEIPYYCPCDKTLNHTNDERDTMEEVETGTGFHHRLYPYMDALVQYANEQEDKEPWIVRDRSTALRNERHGRGAALVRTWVPDDWTYVNREEARD